MVLDLLWGRGIPKGRDRGVASTVCSQAEGKGDVDPVDEREDPRLLCRVPDLHRQMHRQGPEVVEVVGDPDVGLGGPDSVTQSGCVGS